MKAKKFWDKKIEGTDGTLDLHYVQQNHSTVRSQLYLFRPNSTACDK